MKYSFAVLAIVANVQAIQLKTSMDLEQMTNESSQVMKKYEGEPKHYQVKVDNPEEIDDRKESDMLSKDGDTAPKSTSLIQMKARNLMRSGMEKVMETADDFSGFDPSHNGFIGNNHNGGQWVDAYNREIPHNFDTSEDHPVDMFTQNVLANFATEGVTKEGKPDGHFFITKDQARLLAKEVTTTHLGYTGDKQSKFLDKYFEDTWHHYDVNDEGTMDSLWVSTLMRALCKPVKDIDLQ